MALHPLVAEHLDEIRALAEKYGVEKLEIFGSAMTDAFDPERSDVDFIVHYPEGYKFGDFGSRLFEFENKLTETLGRKAEVIMTSALKSAYFREESSRTQWPIYPESLSRVTPPPSPRQSRDIQLRITRNLVDIQVHCRFILEDIDIRSRSELSQPDTMNLVVEHNLMRIGQRARGVQRHNPTLLSEMPSLQQMIPLSEEIASRLSSELNHDHILRVAKSNVSVIQREVEATLARL